ncbi:hypothetical protein NBRC110019_06580 [Neptunitalea chrysea]|uniref:Uncharacterized protein n=1 Tax=Neptunitalea chrysea TaxID=1647581 RepID=A0A9W6ETT7_9FLAO|nr:hypothetical protein [Neptunitalea chrysea]GLB51619.1 hypothetical protein NBRC110019_06580 [Neptunitalea chrysea]
MARAMLEYTKTILSKVSFDAVLFKKELEKAVKRLLPYEIEELRLWLKRFTIQNPELSECILLLNN